MIDADVTAVLVRKGSRWTGPVVVSNGSVVVPETRGNKLLAVGGPSDLVITDAPAKVAKIEREAPRDPWVVVDVDLRSTEVQSEIFRGAVGGSFKLSIGDTVGLDSAIATERGDVEISSALSHRARDARAGTLDPNLGIRSSVVPSRLTADIRAR